MLKKLVFIAISSTLFYILLSSCQSALRGGEGAQSDDTPADAGHLLPSKEVCLTPSEDAGAEYLDSIVFLGESTTYHMKSRGVLKGGFETDQVWAPQSGTLMLDQSTAHCRIVYPESGEELDLSEALRRKKPTVMMLTFGLNGAVSNLSRGEEYFKSNYKRLISAVKENSPNSKIIIQSCFPVAKNIDPSLFSVDSATLNIYIDRLNLWASELALSEGVGYLNSSEILKDEMGYLRDDFQVGDGYHLTRSAYEEILYYIRTHKYQ